MGTSFLRHTRLLCGKVHRQLARAWNQADWGGVWRKERGQGALQLAVGRGWVGLPEKKAPGHGRWTGAKPAERVGLRSLCLGEGLGSQSGWPRNWLTVQLCVSSWASVSLFVDGNSSSCHTCPVMSGLCRAFWSPGQRDLLAGTGPSSRPPFSEEGQGSRIPGPWGHGIPDPPLIRPFVFSLGQDPQTCSPGGPPSYLLAGAGCPGSLHFHLLRSHKLCVAE